MPIIFQNESTLPLECISTFGVSAKVNDSPIGYFGTGLKYALAVLLREGCKVVIFTDRKEYHFRTEQRDIRGKGFGFIYMNNIALPFTIELGRNWELWQAYRELYSNCMDEAGEVVSVGGMRSNALSHGTVIVVDGLDAIHAESSGFILRSDPKYRLDDVEIHESKTTSGVFYKGIKVLDLPTKYTYNVLDDLELTEDRTVSQCDAERVITAAISTSSNIEMLMDVLAIDDMHYHESKFNWSRYSTPSEAFMKLVSKMKRPNHTLGNYYGYHEPEFLGKLDRSILADSTQKKLRRLQASLQFKPAEIFVADMATDYRIIPEGLVLNFNLLAQPKKLNFIYRLACLRMGKKINARVGDFSVVTDFMLSDFSFTTIRQLKIRNSAPRRKAA